MPLIKRELNPKLIISLIQVVEDTPTQKNDKKGSKAQKESQKYQKIP